jgi:hypothetical protein
VGVGWFLLEGAGGASARGGGSCRTAAAGGEGGEGASALKYRSNGNGTLSAGGGPSAGLRRLCRLCRLKPAVPVV